jgi:hypothetical protein
MPRARTIRSSPPSGPAQPVAATGAPTANRRLSFAVAIWGAIFVVYVPSLSAGFIWDDDDYVTQNATLRTDEGLRQIWFDPQATPQYYPLVFTSFWVEYQLWGLRPAGYHLVNAALHATNGVLVWLILRRLSVPGAWLAALAFGLHPVHVETVSWISERKNVLSGLFYLIALRTLIEIPTGPPPDAPSAESRRYWLRYAVGFSFFVAALLCKSVTCSLPAVLLLLAWWKGGRLTLRGIWPLIPFFLVGAAFASHTSWLELTHVGASGSVFRVDTGRTALDRGTRRVDLRD